MKIFISTGFSGRERTEVLKRIEVLKQLAHKHFITEDSAIEWVHNYFYEAREDIKYPRMDCLGEAIKKLSDCDVIVLDADYNNYNGCCIEKQIANIYGLRILRNFYDIELIECDNGKYLDWCKT